MIRAEDSKAQRTASPLPSQLARGTSCHFAMGGTISLPQFIHPFCTTSQPCLLTSNWSTEKIIKTILPLNKNICHCPKLNKGKLNPPSSSPEKSQGTSHGWWQWPPAMPESVSHPVAMQCNCRWTAVWSFVAGNCASTWGVQVRFRFSSIGSIGLVPVCVVLALLAG